MIKEIKELIAYNSFLHLLRVPINYLLVNLAMADIMFATFIAPQYILSQTFTHPGGVTGKVLCKLLTGGNFAWVGAASSVFTLVNISMERYYAVMYPLSNKGNLSERKIMVSDAPRKKVFTFLLNHFTIEPFYYCFGQSLEYHFVSHNFRYKNWILYIFMLMRPKN